MILPRLTSNAHLAGLLIVLALLAAACVPLAEQPAQVAATPLPPSAPSTPTPWPPAQRAIAALAAQLSIAPAEIKLVSAEPVDWPDGCLGVFQRGVMCTQAIVPGYRLILETNGEQYEVHTDLTGNQALLAPAVSQAAPIGPRPNIALRQAIATRLGLPASQVQVSAIEPMTWPDACLAAPQPDELCAEALTPGYRVTVEAEGVRYVFHTDESGAQVRPAPLTTEDTALTDILRDLVAAQLSIEADRVEVISMEAVDWPDACLGVQIPDLGCAQVLTPGFKIALQAEGGLFIYHTDATGDSILLVQQMTTR